MNKKLLFFVTEDWYFCSHRLPLALSAKQAGYDVLVVTRVKEHGDRITGAGLRLIPLPISRRGINPLTEFALIFRLISIYRSERPDIVHHVALKPVLYGSIASLATRIPYIVNAMAGLGILFSSNSLRSRLLRPILKLSFRFFLNRQNTHVLLQNPDDVQLMCDDVVLDRERITLIRGSGVDTDQFRSSPEPPGDIIVVLASRMLWDKGVGEFVEAARKLKQNGTKARFVLVGKGDKENPSGISDKILQEWHSEGVIEWWGHRDDMPEVFACSHIVCLPSYYGEGVPKVLIEAASCARPIVTTNTPGCREIVRDGINGILIPTRNVEAITVAVSRLIASPELRVRMGEKGREMVESEFSVEKVNAETLRVYKGLVR